MELIIVEIVFKDDQMIFVRKLKKIDSQLISGIKIIDSYVPANGIILTDRHFDISDNVDRYESCSEGKQIKSK